MTETKHTAGLCPRSVVAEWAPDCRALAARHERVSATMALFTLEHLEAAEAREADLLKQLDELRAEVERLLSEDERMQREMARLRMSLALASATLEECCNTPGDLDALRAALARADKATEAAIKLQSVANDCRERWSRGHAERVAKAEALLAEVGVGRV